MEIGCGIKSYERRLKGAAALGAGLPEHVDIVRKAMHRAAGEPVLAGAENSWTV